ncbi:TPA: hypothetical protein ACH3X1_015536 [Trebouxia sp. C0004]
MATVSETAGCKALDREILLRRFLEYCYSHDDQGPCSNIPMLARFLLRSAEVQDYLTLYELTLEQRHDLLEEACLALMQTESDKAPSKWDLNAVGIALRSAVHYHYIITAEAAEAELEAASEATGGIVPMVTDQRAGAPSHKAGDYDPLNPEGLIAKAFVAQRERAATTREAGELQVSDPRPERGGEFPAEFHGRVEQLGQFAIDWLYQAQLWVQAEGFVRPVAKVVTYLKGDALAWWRDAGEEQLGTVVSFLQFKVAFLAKFVEASDSLTARIDLEACKQDGLSIEAYASKFKSISSRIMVGCQVDRTTQAQWFLKGMNGKVVNKLQGTVDHSVLMDIDSLVTAAINVVCSNMMYEVAQPTTGNGSRVAPSGRRMMPVRRTRFRRNLRNR